MSTTATLYQPIKYGTGHPTKLHSEGCSHLANADRLREVRVGDGHYRRWTDDLCQRCLGDMCINFDGRLAKRPRRAAWAT